MFDQHMHATSVHQAKAQVMADPASGARPVLSPLNMYSGLPAAQSRLLHEAGLFGVFPIARA